MLVRMHWLVGPFPCSLSGTQAQQGGIPYWKVRRPDWNSISRWKKKKKKKQWLFLTTRWGSSVVQTACGCLSSYRLSKNTFPCRSGCHLPEGVLALSWCLRSSSVQHRCQAQTLQDVTKSTDLVQPARLRFKSQLHV